MLKQLERLQYMDYLIRIEGTGKLQDFADKLEISRSTCGEYIRILRDMGADIEYCHYRKSYRYTTPLQMFIGFKCRQSGQLLSYSA